MFILGFIITSSGIKMMTNFNYLPYCCSDRARVMQANRLLPMMIFVTVSVLNAIQVFVAVLLPPFQHVKIKFELI